MNRYCERCERVTTDGHLWCERVDCPAEEGYPVLAYGEYLGDLKIIKLLRVWRTAALYEARRGNEKDSVLLKVAHTGDDCEERLKREAAALNSLADRPNFIQSFFPTDRPLLPVPVAPYPVPSKSPFGQISFRGEIKFYSVFKYAQGKFLSDLLLENPQLWHYQAAWIIITLTQALRPLAAKNRANLCLSPDKILVEEDKDGILRPLLLDLGFMVSGDEVASIIDWQRLNEPGYTAPELLAGQRPKTVTAAADVYSLGEIFFEMLAGKPSFDSKLTRDEVIRQAVTSYRGQMPVERPELEHAGVVKAVEQSLALTGRFGNAVDFGKALKTIYSDPPREKRPVPTRFYVVLGIVAVVLLIVLGIAGFLVLQVVLRSFGGG